MTALTNKDFKQGWIDSYYPYGQYMIENNNLILGGDEIKVNNEILTQQVIKQSTSGYSQTGGRKKNKKYKIQGDSIEDAFRKLEEKARKYFKGGKGDILVLNLESLDDKNNINFIKIFRKKI
jgi:hypothetical protein